MLSGLPPVVQPAEQQSAPAASRARRWLGPALVIAFYAALSLVGNWPSWWHGGAHWLACGGCGDNGQEVWFLASGAHSLGHLNNPLRTTWINAPYGVDLADNTAMPIVGMIGAPITWLFGPIATYNVVFSFSFFSAATAAFFAARRFVTWLPAAFLAGLLYGFSPYIVGQGRGHIFLMLIFVFPLILIVLDEVLFRQRRSWWIGGLALGVLTVVQLGISVEMLVDAVFAAAVGGVLACIMFRRQVRSHAPHALAALALAAVVSLPFVLFYFVTSRTGPEHIAGAIHSVQALSGLASNLYGVFIPTSMQAITFGHAGWSSNLVAMTPPGRPPVGDVTENGAYLGIPLVVFLIGGMVLCRRQTKMAYFFLMALFCFVLSLGPNLHVGNRVYQLHMPFRFFLHFPLLDNAIASRWSAFMWLFVGLMAGLSLEAARNYVSARRAAGRPVGPAARAVLPGSLVLAGAAIVALTPAWPYVPLQQAWVPTWFTSHYEKAVTVGSNLLTYPLPSDGFSFPMVWQAVDGLRYRIPGGEAGAATVHYLPLENALQACYLQPSLKEPVVSSWSAARAELHRYGIKTIVAPPVHPWFNQACAVRFFTTLTRESPKLEDGAYVWSNLKT
jgi:hypothetical protein